MTVFELAALLVVLAAALGFLNYRLVSLPHTVGLTVMGALASFALVGIDAVAPGFGIRAVVDAVLGEVDFARTLLDALLSFLLFAGALHVDLTYLLQRRWLVLALATFGVLLSTAMIGLAFWHLAGWFGFGLPLLWCLVFGALISPTDPVAVMSILKTLGVPPALEAAIAGESLFNDGVGVVLFLILLAAAGGGEALSVGRALELFFVEAAGGFLLGLGLGWIAYRAMKAIDEHNLEVLISLALVMGGYALAGRLGVSGPVAMAAAGLLIGNHAYNYAMSDRTRRHLTDFWSLLDEILNSVLFLLIGLEVAAIDFAFSHILAGLIAIPLVLVARAASIGLPFALLRGLYDFAPGAYAVMVWGGLRGGISIALALLLPAGPLRDTVLTATFLVVLFSVVVQGTTIGLLARRFFGRELAREG